MSQRIWLDATLEEEEENGQHSDHQAQLSVPPVPALPAALEAALALDNPFGPAKKQNPHIAAKTPHHHRRNRSQSTSLPSLTVKAKRKTDSATVTRARVSVNNQELISNLIDSLSTIAIPAQHHFENLPDTYHSKSVPTSPSIQQPAFLNPNHHHRDEGYGNYLDAEDAAEPPVIRTSKPPSGLSHLTAGRTSKSSSIRDYILSSRRSSASLNGQRGADDDSRSIGNISIDNSREASRRPSNISVDSSPSKKGRVRSLGYQPSRERLRSKERPMKEADIEKRDSLPGANQILALNPDQRPEPPRRYSSATTRSTRKRSLQAPGPIKISSQRGGLSGPPSATLSAVSPPLTPLTPLSPRSPLAFPSSAKEGSPESKPVLRSPGKRAVAGTPDEFQSSLEEAKGYFGTVDTNVVPLRRSSLRPSDPSPKNSLKPAAGSSKTNSPSRKGSATMAGKALPTPEKELPSTPEIRQVTSVIDPAKDDKSKSSSEDSRSTLKRGGRKVDSGIDKGLGGEEDVLRRIQELKAQKEQRDREFTKVHLGSSPGQDVRTSSDNTPGANRSLETSPHATKGTSTGSSPSGQGNIQQQNPRSQPASRVSQDGTPMLSPVKAHKVLGLSGASSPTSPSEIGSEKENASTQKTRLKINTTAAPYEPEQLTPTALPIDYSLIMQRLDGKGTPPQEMLSKKSETAAQRVPIEKTQVEKRPEKPVDKTITTEDHMDPKSKQLPPKPVGGRSATARHTKSLYVGPIRDRSESPEWQRPEVPGKDRSDGTPPRQVYSLDGESPPSDLEQTKPQRSKSTAMRRKRWSHPDLPLGMQPVKRSNTLHNDLAVKPVGERTPPEEHLRPDTASSIEAEVSAFLTHPRLSKKVRHPHTGRTIAFSDVGDPDGHAVFVCVGMGLTRYITTFYDELAATLHLRLITPDRPGVGDSAADPTVTPLSWPDDVAEICRSLGIKRFSVLAHSAGAIYALAVALRMGEMVRGRVHLLAPWIPPSQMSGALGSIAQNGAGMPQPGQGLTRSQRLLRVLPTSFLRVANSGLLGVGSASVGKKAASPQPKSMSKKKTGTEVGGAASTGGNSPPQGHTRRESIMLMDQQTLPNKMSTADLRGAANAAAKATSPNGKLSSEPRNSSARGEHRRRSNDEARALAYDTELTSRTWALATTNSNPAVDLLVCLERERTIGFRYVDITRPVVIHHGSKDTRVPVDNVKWLGRMMKKCEVRILEGEGHGLMASAGVMGGILMEIGDEWGMWERASRGERARREGGRERVRSERVAA